MYYYNYMNRLKLYETIVFRLNYYILYYTNYYKLYKYI